MPWNKKQFFAIMYNTKNKAKKEEYAKEQGLDKKEAKKVVEETSNV